MTNADLNDWISFPCIEMTQPIGKSYIGVIDSSDLIDISYADIRRVEERDVEKILGIQRPLSENRVKELKQYVKNYDATFPTSIILAIDSENARYDSITKVMQIKREAKVAKILDGQHRLAGLEGYTGTEPFEVNVTIFVDMDVENQAMIFATINLAQTKVNKSLVYDLYELTRRRSPQKTCHNIAKFLNIKEGSPFKGRIKMLGVSTEKYQLLTQAAIVESLINLISQNPLNAMKDRDYLLRGIQLKRASETEEKRLIFRNMFIDKKDAEITKLIWDFFSAVQKKWPEAWDGVDQPGNILPRTNGFRALIRFFAKAYPYLGGSDLIYKQEDFARLLDPIAIDDREFTTREYNPGASGETALLKDLINGALIFNND